MTTKDTMIMANKYVVQQESAATAKKAIVYIPRYIVGSI